MTPAKYITNLNTRFKTGISREHSYRGDLQTLLEDILKDVLVTNEPARVACGAPDYILTKKNIPLGYIEAKDIGKPLDSKEYDEQFKRYRKSLNNLIITDYVNFWLYKDGEKVTQISIGFIDGNTIKPTPESFDAFVNLIKDFAENGGQTITSASKLSKMMAGKARMLANVILNALESDEDTDANTSLRQQLKAFDEILIHDIKPKEFADIYAQTIAYGMFAARLHDPSLEDFSRQEAAELIPKSNPFLRKLFQYIAGYDLDTRIKWIVDDLADIFRATDVAALLQDFGKATQQNDPIIHFYETFLAEYDPKLRKSKGVWYTPEPVVNFMVRAVDDILKTEFSLKDGIADTSKIPITIETQTWNKRKKKFEKYEKQVHKVQILDPATGTGTFLAEVVSQIHNKYKNQQGIWSSYVENDLIPRLNGFEILMASYAMAHLKMEMLLESTGYVSKDNQRLKIYLTNTLEKFESKIPDLFGAQWLSDEAQEANQVKRESPVMVVLGNPPYSGISSNMGKWISDLIEDYKYVDGEHFGERKHWLHDDYVKFIRYGEFFINRTEEGVLAFINNHSFLDNPTFRGMRWHLLDTFDKIYVIDLHGNAKKKEISPNGTKDENVFDIQQGVSINLFVKTGKKKKGELAEVYHTDLWGKRKDKYKALWDNSLKTFDFVKVECKDPYYFMLPKDYESEEEYDNGLQLEKLFTEKTSGVQTSRDFLVVDVYKTELKNRITSFTDVTKTDYEIRESFFAKSSGTKYPKGDSRGWKIAIVRPKLRNISIDDIIKPFSYRPFDKQFIAYTPLLVDWTREKVLNHMLNDNVSLTIGRQGQVTGNSQWNLVFVQDTISDLNLFYRGGGSVFPLYLYPETTGQQSIEEAPARTPNLNKEIVAKLAKALKLKFTAEKEDDPTTFAPIDILDYIYAILHSPAYREKYKEFLKIDFPRVPYPKEAKTFWQYVKLGSELRQIHLLESPVTEKYMTTYPIEGDNEVVKPKYEDNKVYINDTQYFEGVPQVAWEFYIGGYQPAQKWLKDRKGRALDFNDVLHYQKIIVALSETSRIMQEIDKI